MLEGSVSAVGPNTMISLVATDCENGTTIAREQAEVQRKEDVLRALGDADRLGPHGARRAAHHR